MIYFRYMNHTLESLKLFPVIAWSLIIGFCIFTWTLTLHLKNEVTNISLNVERMEQQVNEIHREKSQRNSSTSVSNSHESNIDVNTDAY